MKKVILLVTIVFLYSCSATTSVGKKSLYEILLIKNDDGANIKFFEILTEPKEIKMLLGDPELSKQISEEDTKKSSFVILNAGPTSENHNKISIQKVIETPTHIEIYITDTQKNTPVELSDDNTFHPYTVLKINSKKPIVIK